MNPYLIFGSAIGGVLLAVVLTLGGFKAGQATVQEKWNAAELQRAERIVVRLQREVVEVPKIVVRTVEREKIVEKEIERVVAAIPHLLDADCVLPEHYGELLVGAARGLQLDPATGAINATAGTYGCREVLTAVLEDLEAGYKNSARLAGLQDFVRVKQLP